MLANGCGKKYIPGDGPAEIAGSRGGPEGRSTSIHEEDKVARLRLTGIEICVMVMIGTCLVAMASGIFVCGKALKDIDERGLKGVIEDVWEGSGSKGSDTASGR